MLWLNILLRSLVVIEPHCVLVDGTANFIIYLIMLLSLMLLSLGQMVLSPYYLLCHCGSWCYYGTWNHVGVRGSPRPWCYGLLFEFEFWWLDQHFTPYMWKLVFANISIWGWVIDSNWYCLFDGPSNIWSSLPIMLKFSKESSWPVMLWWSWMGEGALIYSLNLSANVLPGSPV